MTCHQECTIPDDGKKYRCAVMKPYNKNAKCAWDKHKNASFWLKRVKTIKTICYEELKKKAVDGKTEIESVIANIEKDIDYIL